MCNFLLTRTHAHTHMHTHTHFIIRTKLVEELKFSSFISLSHFTLPATLSLNGKRCNVITLLCCIKSSVAVDITFYSSSVAPINCDKQEREKTNQSRTVKSCIAALQARHGLLTSLMECTTVEWNFNQSHIYQCPLAFHVLKASVVLFVRYCDQDEWRGVGVLPLVDMFWFTVHIKAHMYRLQSPGDKYAPQPARDE